MPTYSGAALRLDPQERAAHARFRLGATTPVTVGAASPDSQVADAAVRFTVCILSIGEPLSPGEDGSHSGAAAPTGSPLVVTVLRSRDLGSTWIDQLASNAAGYPQLSPGQPYSETSLDSLNGLLGDRFRVQVLSVGSGVAGQDVLVTLVGFLKD